MEQREQMNIVITGHVDHGKSTVIGRLLADTGSLPDGKLEKVRRDCERNSKPFEYAFLLDALKDEQSQGITIDAARVFFKSVKRDYIIMDAPGHIEFLKNMVTGAARAEAAFLVIDAEEGVQENSRRHGYILSMLGIRQLCVVVNKMDLVDYSKKVYNQVIRKYSKFLKNIDIEGVTFIPVSGREGDNISTLSEKMSWWQGDTVLSLLDKFRKQDTRENLPFRLPVQDVYKFTQQGDSRRIIAGTVETGRLNKDDELIFYPSGKKSLVHRLESFIGEAPDSAAPGEAVGFTMTEQIYAKRGNLVARAGEPQPSVGRVLRVNLFWLGRKPLEMGKEYILKVGTDRVKVQLFDTIRVIDASSLSTDSMKKRVERHDVADCVLTTQRAIAFDQVDVLPQTSRFVIVDDFEIAGGGIIRELIRDNLAEERERIQSMNQHWETGNVSMHERKKRFGHKAHLVLISGEDGSFKHDVAKALERRLFDKKYQVLYLGFHREEGSAVDFGDSRRKKKLTAHQREELLQQMSEAARVSLQAGIIFILTASELTQDEQEKIRMAVAPEKQSSYWLGEQISTDIIPDFHVKDTTEAASLAERMEEELKKRKIIGTT